MEEREEERATTVPNREGKPKSRWAVASLPRFTKGRPGLHVGSEILLLLAVVSLICWNGTTCQRNMVCNFSCKMRSGRVGPRCRISYRPLFFNIQSEWIAPVVITRERIYRLARWAGGNNLSAKSVDPCLVFFGFSYYDHWIE